MLTTMMIEDFHPLKTYKEERKKYRVFKENFHRIINEGSKVMWSVFGMHWSNENEHAIKKKKMNPKSFWRWKLLIWLEVCQKRIMGRIRRNSYSNSWQSYNREKKMGDRQRDVMPLIRYVNIVFMASSRFHGAMWLLKTNGNNTGNS